MICFRRLTGAAIAVVAASGALAQDKLPPAAQCAAFWYGYAEYAERSPYLDIDPRDRQFADAFRAAAVRVADPDASVDRFIEDQRPLMLQLVDAYIYSSDRQSRDLFERQLATCSDVAANHPETREFR